jgi:hypothetical protein
MPTIQSMEIPEPQSWQEFETIVRDAQNLRWNTSLQKNGRPGQAQQGVDIWGPDELGRRIGIQCKRYKKALTLKDVTDELNEADRFEGGLSALFLATTAAPDSKLQATVRGVSDQRVAQGKCAVGLLFWDEIVGSLMMNPIVFKSHYPQFQIPNFEVADPARLVAALELGFYGADLLAYINLIFGEIGQLAQEDPEGVSAILRILEGRVQQLLSPEDSGILQEWLRFIRKGCSQPNKKDADWYLIEVHAKRISTRIKAASSLLSLSESNALDLGLQLGLLYHHADDVPKTAVQRTVEKKVRAILSESSDLAIKEAFSSAKKTWGGYQWANRICSLVEHELRFSSNTRS